MANELVRGMMALVTGDDLTQDASEVPFVPTGTISATTVQAAVAETNTEAAHLAGTETITGAKTFSLAPIAPGVTAPAATSLALTSPLGAGATDVCVKAGTTASDASVNVSAKLVSVRTGIGGTEAEKVAVAKSGGIYTQDGLYSGISGNASFVNFQSSGVVFATGQPQQNLTMVPSYGSLVHTSLRVQSYTDPLQVYSGQGAGASDVAVKIGTRIADASVSATAKLCSLRTGVGGTEVEKAYVAKSGELNVVDAGVGIVLHSPDGTAYRVTVANGGTLSVTAV